ncbi:hypothetical protein BUL40_10370 [Croceivirga radicis]|uniref:Uncharacterized protein n=1 Tax=Croceivirga radicis TaxID=1929488 RepID=A0A1V6LRC7_9FLAO|nr:hypothetical protein [Croceivirga radicis]OQD42516.1 hypothetical protein BUL40_10370 [Croceivirga radicis]
MANNIRDVRSFTDEVKTTYLNWDDIKKLEDITLDDAQLDIARDWLLIGCSIGQRAGDLMQLSKDNFLVDDNLNFIELIQQKTNTHVIVWLDDDVQKILDKYDNDFPPIFSEVLSSNLAIFNRKIKEVCRLAGINNMIEGAKMNPQTNRKEVGIYYKYELVTSYICRRSFATNRYGLVPTEYIIMRRDIRRKVSF